MKTRLVKISAMLLLGALALTACVSKTASPPEPSGFMADGTWKPSKAESKAWRSLLFRTSVKQVAADRLVVDAWGRPGKGIDSIEMRLLARAGAEAQKLGYSHFAIVQIQDRNLPKAGGLMPPLGLSIDPVWIGKYEDLVLSRFEREQGAAPRTWLVPGLESVIVLLNEDDRRAGKSFSAPEMFDYLGRTGVAQ